MLKSLALRSSLPWVVLRDINDLLFQSEKRGRVPHPDNLLRGFGETLDVCGLLQVPTWERGSGTEAWVEERLDRVVACKYWCTLLEAAKVINILTRTSDHSAIFLGVNETRVSGGSTRRGFRFEMAWLLDAGCRGVVEQA